MRALTAILCITLGFSAAPLAAQPPAPPVSTPAAAPSPTLAMDLSALPAELKNLPWQGVDLTAVSPIDRIRALMLMSDVLDELAAQSVSEADLMSAYIEASNQGAALAALRPVSDPAPLTMDDVQKIAVALLRGPMARSSYATQLGSLAPDELGAYEQMYLSSCRREWTEMTDNRLRVRRMADFLAANGKFADYQAWLPGEIKLRDEQQAAREAQEAADAATDQARAQEQDLQRQSEERQQAILQMQQAMCAAQQSQSAAPPVVVNDVYPSWYYGGLNYVGAPWHHETWRHYTWYHHDWRRRGWYHHAWHHNAWHRGAAQHHTNVRFSHWHGGHSRR